MGFLVSNEGTVQLGEVVKTELQTQQWDVSENWFNKTQHLQVAGEYPKLKFAHVKYMGPGGFEPTIVLTIDYQLYGDTFPALGGELIFFVHARDGALPEAPESPAWTRNADVTQIVGKDGRLFTVYTEKQKDRPVIVQVPCNNCEGTGNVEIALTALGDSCQMFKSFQCGDCGGTGKVKL